MKRVSFNVAKALKEAGYPQGVTPYQYVTKDYDTFKEGDIIDSFYENWAGDNVIDTPSYLEVWLWLWKEKGHQIQLLVNGINDATAQVWNEGEWQDFDNKSPEEAIVSAIEYLVDNDLIK